MPPVGSDGRRGRRRPWRPYACVWMFDNDGEASWEWLRLPFRVRRKFLFSRRHFRCSSWSDQLDSLCECGWLTFDLPLFFKEHQNFVAQDETLGPVLLSVKHEMLAGQDYVRLILRLQTGTLHEVVPATCLSDQASPHRMAKVRNNP